MNGLDLFSGIGGISLALRDYVRPIAYCEIDPYCQGVLLSRMADRSIPKASIWDDIRTLRGNEIGSSVDIIFGGFPCQDISIAGNGKGLAGERSGLFFEIVRLAQEIKPRFIFLENVPAITTRGGIEVVQSITSLRYDCRWCVISAAFVGALHSRERFFLLAHYNSKSSRKTDKETKSDESEQEAWLRLTRQNRRELPRTYWEKNQCPVYGMDDGLPFEVDRARTLGNSVVPQQVKKAFEILMGII